jgi:hypothetical protein
MARAESEHRFGVGYLYWQSLGDIAEAGFDEDGTAPFVTYQYVPEGIFRLELDVEYYEGGFGDPANNYGYDLSPLAFVLVEFGIYAGLGVGVTVSDGLEDNISDPFYAARLGWDFQLIPRLHFDINANYRADTFKELEDYNQDSFTLGAAVRVAFK